jgi:hypothetical protein
MDAPSLNIGRSCTAVDLERELKKRLRSSFYDRQEPTNWAADVNDQVCMDITLRTIQIANDQLHEAKTMTDYNNFQELCLLECKKQSFHQDNDIAT